jgi:hypothetical protein
MSFSLVETGVPGAPGLTRKHFIWAENAHKGQTL